ncbi:MAG: FHA domain-containing protein [Acidobacteriota bacterium]
MIVVCPSCGARYNYDESRFGEAASKRLKCSKCATVFDVFSPQEDGSGEVLHTRVGSRRPPEETTKQLEVKGLQSEGGKPLPQLAPLATNRRYSLAVILGANAGQIYALKQPRIVLGRGAGTDIQLQDSEISRRHAMIEIKGDTASIVDLGSTNGTFVDGQRVQQADLAAQQEFSLGTTTLMLIVTELGDAATG